MIFYGKDVKRIVRKKSPNEPEYAFSRACSARSNFRVWRKKALDAETKNLSYEAQNTKRGQIFVPPFPCHSIAWSTASAALACTGLKQTN